MAAFTEAPSGMNFPASYRDAAGGLYLRVFDPTESQLPEWVESVEVGDRLGAVVTWGTGVVSADVSRRWGVSIDELVTTATRNVRRIPFERRTLEDAFASMVATLGHPWVSSLIIGLDAALSGPEGTIVAIPRTDVMLTMPVVGVSTIDCLERIMTLCDEIYDPGDAGVSPHVWWSWNGKLHRITDRLDNGEVDIEPATNLGAFYFSGALRHLADPG